AQVVLEDPLAFTELHLSFDNPENRTREGTFRIALPRGAAISRFAMSISGRWQEGEVVERQAARQSYEDFLRRGQDPAVLEQGAGSEFTARVFPIAPRSRKEIVVSFSSEITPSAPYTLTLRGLGTIGKLDLRASASGAPVASLLR